jgi:predicted transcriptional regulator
MNVKLRTIELDADTATALEELAAARNMTLAEFLAKVVEEEQSLPASFGALRETGRGPWAPEILAEDARRFADFERSGEGVPWDEIRAWMRSWGTPNELSPPKPRKL